MLAREAELPEGSRTEHFLRFVILGRLPLEPMASVVVLFGGAFFTLGPPSSALVRAVDLKLVPPLISQLGGDMIASGASVIILASSLTKVLLGTRSMEVGTPSRL